MDKKKIINFFKKYRKILIIILAPLITSIFPIVVQTKASKCAFVVIIMAISWVTEALPIAVTALFPIIFYPLLGILPSEKVCPLYLKEIVWLFIGGLIVANAIESTRLHERISLLVLSKFGSDPKWLMLGFMITTAFLSLWISNTASTAMMLPVIEAVVQQLIKCENSFTESKSSARIENDSGAEVEENEIEYTNIKNNNNSGHIKMSNKGKKLATGFLLSCSYSASIGGIGSLVGTPPNLLLKGYFDKYYPKINLGFFNYMLFSLPVTILMLFISWTWLVIRWLPKNVMCECTKMKKDKQNHVSTGLNDVFKEKRSSLGKMSWAEKCVGVAFLLLIVLWITRDLHVVPGWSYFFLPKYVSDTTPVVLIAILMFILPRENIFAGKHYTHLLDWKTVQRNFPWDVILLSGGSLAMADGFLESGLSVYIGSQLKTFANSKKEIILLVIQTIPAFLTEFASNTSIASIFLPIIDTLAQQSNIEPLYLMLPMTLSVSLAFMLPVATPNNALIFASGHIRIIDMITTGFVMNIIGLGVIYLAGNTWLNVIFTTKSLHTTIINSSNITNSTILKSTFL